MSAFSRGSSVTPAIASRSVAVATSSAALLDSPPPVRAYAPGSWGPNAIHQLVAPHAWRLPFERAWRDPNTRGS